MFKTKLLSIFFLLLLTFGGAFGSSTLTGGVQGLAKRVVEYRLPNGMKWLFVKNGKAPTFSGIVMVKVGGIDEEPGRTGLAHMLEHMAFKGTKDMTPEELWDAFVVNGATNLNAYTSKDVTAYHSSLPSAKLELWAYLTSGIIKSSTDRDFYKERDVVLEELVGKMENNPSRKLSAKFFETAFEKSPYKWPTIGAKEDVAKLEPADLMAFKKKFYTPSRMTGVIVGNFNIEEAKGIVNRYFGNIPAVKPLKEDFPKEPDQSAARSATIKFDASKELLIGFHKPTAPHRDDYVFDIMSYILCGSDSARLKKNLVFEKKLVKSIGCDPGEPGIRLNNLFVVEAEPLGSHSYEEVVGAIKEELNLLKNEKVPEAELQSAKNNIIRDYIFGLKESADLAETLVYVQTNIGDWHYIVDHPGIMEKITPDDIQRVARQYLNDENSTTVTLKK